MKNTILASIIAVICTAAICITGVSVSKNVLDSKDSDVSAYMTEEEAMEYIGVNATVFELLKDDLKFFEGAYAEYTYVDANSKEATITVYNKEKLDEAVSKFMTENSKLNFKFIQEAKAKTAK